MGIAERRDRAKQETRRLFLDAARKVLIEEGFDALTMRRVAEVAEYSPAALYVHFEDKTTLVRELCSHDFAVFTQELRGAPKVDDPVERLAQLAQKYAAFALQYPQQYRLLFLTPRPAEAGKLAERGNPEQDAYAILEEAVRHAIHKGMFARMRETPSLVAQTLWAGLHGVVALELLLKDEDFVHFEPMETRLQTMSWTLITGLEAAHAPPASRAPASPRARAVRKAGRPAARALGRRRPR
jgi:AcrR family transcriptional regulator